MHWHCCGKIFYGKGPYIGNIIMALSESYLEQLAYQTLLRSQDTGRQISTPRAAQIYRGQVRSVLNRENLALDPNRKQTYVRYAARLKGMLLRAARSENIILPVQSITHTDPYADNFGRVSITLQIDGDVLWRDSLYMHQNEDGSSSGDKYGTDNILAQLESGWSNPGGRAPAGYWHGKYIRGRGKRTGTNALLSAIQRFNASVPEGITAQLLPEFSGLRR